MKAITAFASVLLVFLVAAASADDKTPIVGTLAIPNMAAPGAKSLKLDSKSLPPSLKSALGGGHVGTLTLAVPGMSGRQARRIVSIQNVYLASRKKPSYLSDAMPKLHGSDRQGEKWNLIPKGADTWAIQNVYLASRKKPSYLSDAMPKLWNTCSKGELWHLIHEGRGIYIIRNVYTGKYLSDNQTTLWHCASTGEKWRLRWQSLARRK